MVTVPAGSVGLLSIISVACKALRMLFPLGGAFGNFDMSTLFLLADSNYVLVA
jgi:hypothetical protein